MARVEEISLPLSEGSAAVAVPSTGIPPLIRRNMLLLAAAEAFVGTGQQMVPTLTSLMVVALFAPAWLAGMGSSTLGLTRLLVSYPSGQLADRFGRKPILLVGLTLALVGAVLLGLALPLRSFPLLALGLLVFGLGNSTSQQQRRLSAADLFPPRKRGLGLGIVLTGSLVGALGGPVLIHFSTTLAGPWHINPLAMSWLLVPAVLVPSIALILLIRPDPRDIASNLGRYYADYVPSSAERSSHGQSVSLGRILRFYPQLVALVCMFVLYGNMSMMMALTPLAMADMGMGLPAISLMVSLHVVGMYGLSAPLGRLVDVLGRRMVLFAGVGISTVGTVLVALTSSYPVIVLGLFLIGLGWSCGNVSTAALVADTAPPDVRGRAMGANLTFSSIASTTLPLLGGVVLQRFGVVGLISVSVLILVPAVMLLLRLREVSPGRYDHGVLLA